MKKLLAGVLALLCVLSLMGCKEQGDVETLDDAGNSATKATAADWDLTSKGEYHLQETLTPDGFVLNLHDAFYTNSTEIAVKNNGDEAVTVYLYNETDRSTPALQLTLQAGETKSFSNLTSRFLYYLCFEPTASGGTIDVTISD